VIVLSVALALGATWACLPDLAVSTPAPTSSCGDGFIDQDAGEECDPGPDGGTSTCLECRVACAVASYPTTIDPSSNHCYFEPGLTPTEALAVSGCEAAGGHVVRFVSQAELSFVSTWATTAPLWVGLGLEQDGWYPNEPTPEPGWVAGCPGCFAGGDDGGAVLDGGTLQRCALAYDTTSPWRATVCGKSHWTVCEREPVGTRARSCGSNVCFTVAAT
jgi:hypothetical protein